MELLSLDFKAAERAGETLAQLQKAGEGIEMPDLLIGSIAREKGYSLHTFNVRHFRRIPGLIAVDASDMSEK